MNEVQNGGILIKMLFISPPDTAASSELGQIIVMMYYAEDFNSIGMISPALERVTKVRNRSCICGVG